MRATFPHMGNLHISLKAMLQHLGVEVVTPPSCSKKTLNLGVKYGPEFACLPMKLNLGNFLEAYEMGADTVIMAGGCGPCRFGYYAQIEHAILKDIGCNMELIVLEPPSRYIFELTGKIKQITGNKPLWQVIQAICYGYQKARALDEVEIAAFKSRPREMAAGLTDAACRKALKLIDRAISWREIVEARKIAGKTMAGIPVDKDRAVLKVGIVGEIYTLLEPFTNLNLETRLGYLGVEVDRSIYLSEWVNDHLFMGLIKGLRSRKEASIAAHPYLRHFVGGHGQETIGNAINYARAGYDGIIQVFPFTCMPEIVAETILPVVSADFGIPVMTLIVDEHTGEAGVMTRLEAFVDLLARKKEMKEAL